MIRLPRPPRAAPTRRPAAPMSLAHLPPVETRRWTVQRKAALVAAVAQGLVSFEEVRQRYRITLDTFISWHKTHA